MTQSSTQTAVEVHPQLTDSVLPTLLRHDHPLWTPRELVDLTNTVVTDLAEPLDHVLRFDDQQRWWVRLALTNGLELWLLSWLPGQHTKPHDHGGAAGAFTVLRGELSEEYRYPQGPIRGRSHKSGHGIGFGAGRAHQVWGAAGAQSASVHAYSPPLVATREYSRLDKLSAQIPQLPANPGT